MNYKAYNRLLDYIQDSRGNRSRSNQRDSYSSYGGNSGGIYNRRIRRRWKSNRTVVRIKEEALGARLEGCIRCRVLDISLGVGRISLLSQRYFNDFNSFLRKESRIQGLLAFLINHLGSAPDYGNLLYNIQVSLILCFKMNSGWMCARPSGGGLRKLLTQERSYQLSRPKRSYQT